LNAKHLIKNFLFLFIIVDLIVSITKTLIPYGLRIGLVGVDLYLSDLVEDFINYHRESLKQNNCQTKYAFLMDRRTGIVISHPAFPRPLAQSDNVFPVDIAYLENIKDFDAIKKKMMHEQSGNYSTNTFDSRNINSKVKFSNH